MDCDTGPQTETPKPTRVPRWIPRIKLRRPPLIVAVLAGAIVGMYFQPLPLRLFFQVTGLEPGAGSSAPFAVPVAKASLPAGGQE